MTMQRVGVAAVIEGLRSFEAGMASMDRSVAQTNKNTDLLAASSKAANAALLALGAGAAAALGASVARAMEFEKAMAGIAAVSGASAAEMQRLSDAARTAGGEFGFLATESAAGIEALIKAGVAVEQIGTALPAALSLAAAGGVAVGEAAEIAANAMNQFSLSGTDMAHVADVVAGAANASAIDVRDFQLSLQQVGAIAAVTGQTFDSTAEAIAVMGSAGIKSSDAGTSLKTMLMNLQPQGKQAKEVMQALGLATDDGANAFFDAEGKAKSFRDIAGTLQKALTGLTEQQKLASLSIIFGSDAARAAAVLAREGAAGFDQMASAMAKVSAEDVAAKRLDSLSGDLQKLREKLDNAATAAGRELTPALREVTRILGDLIPKIAPASRDMDAMGRTMVTGAQAASLFASGINAIGDAINNLPGLDRLNRVLDRLSGRTPATMEFPMQTPEQLAAQMTGIVRGAPYSGEENVAAMVAAEELSKFEYAARDAAFEAAQAAEKARLLALALAGGSGSAAGAAKEAKTAFEELGSAGIGALRRALEDGAISQEIFDATVLALGGSLLETGPIVAGYGLTVRGLSAAFTQAGLDGDALVATILAQQAAVKAEAEAERERTRAIQAAREEEERARAARALALAGIQAVSARDVLGGVRVRGAATGGEAASDFAAAVAGFERLTKAEMDTAVATEVMEQRLASLSAMFTVLSGDDRAAAGAVTDQVRALKAAFDSGQIGAEEYAAGLNALTPELNRLGAAVDKQTQQWADYEKAQRAALKAEALDRNREASKAWADALEADNVRARIAVERETARIADAFKRQTEEALGAAVGLNRAVSLMEYNAITSNEQQASNRQFLNAILEELAKEAGFQERPGGDAALAAQLRQAGEFVQSDRVAALSALAGLGDDPGALNILSRLQGLPGFGSGSATASQAGLVGLPSAAATSGATRPNVTMNMTANYSTVQSAAAVRYDLEAMAMLANL